MNERRCALYRHYDDDRVLLYVGITESLEPRTSGHARSSEWVRYASHAKAEWFDTREEAAAEERKAIETEAPIFNRQYAVGDIEARIQGYIDWRYSQEPEEVLSEFEMAVHTFLICLPKDVREEAERLTIEKYDRLRLRFGRQYEADVLVQVARLLFERKGADDVEPPF